MVPRNSYIPAALILRCFRRKNGWEPIRCDLAPTSRNVRILLSLVAKSGFQLPLLARVFSGWGYQKYSMGWGHIYVGKRPQEVSQPDSSQTTYFPPE